MAYIRLFSKNIDKKKSIIDLEKHKNDIYLHEEYGGLKIKSKIRYDGLPGVDH